MDTPGAKDRMVRVAWIRAVEGSGIVNGVSSGAGRGVVDQAGGHAASLTHGLSQSGEVIILIELDAIHTDHLPPLGRGDALAVLFAQVPRMGISVFSQWAHNGGLLGVGIGQRRHGGTAAAGAGATAGAIHGPKSKPKLEISIVLHGVPPAQVSLPHLKLSRMSTPRPHIRPARHRHGRGARGPLLPHATPRYRSNAERFDMAVLEAYAPIQNAFAEQLAGLDLAVDTVPRMRLSVDMTVMPDEIIADGPVPLGRIVPAGVDSAGQPTRARLVIFRMPVEERVQSAREREELLSTVLTALVANYLNVDPEDIDPRFSW